MKHYLLTCRMAAALLPLLIAGTASLAQKSRPNKAFAMTSEVKGSASWNVIREIDLGTGKVLREVFMDNPAIQPLDAFTGKVADIKDVVVENKMIPASLMKPAFSTGVAAFAFDKEHNRLYYTPMSLNQLRYVDLNGKTPKLYYVQGQSFNPAGFLPDQGGMITRMVIGQDGYGYALTNDANHLIRFTTGRKPKMTDLGPLTDAADGKQASIHTQCGGWGGDMVAGADGSLYLFTANNKVYKINTETRFAQFLGQLKVEPGFTCNGAAVDASGQIVVGSAMTTANYYRVNLEDLSVTKIENNGEAFYNLSDLANGNLAFEKPETAAAPPEARITAVPVKENGFVSVYPNPVSSGSFNVNFDIAAQGQYEIQLTDVLGRVHLSKKVSIAYKNQVERVSYDRKMSKGVYFVRIIDQEKRAVYAERISIQ